MTGDLARQALARQPLAGLTIVDSHCHMGPYNGFFIPEPDAETMFKVMDRCGVRFFCFSSHLAIGPDAAAGNDATAGPTAVSATSPSTHIKTRRRRSHAGRTTPRCSA
jgi:hypothetical protein